MAIFIPKNMGGFDKVFRIVGQDLRNHREISVCVRGHFFNFLAAESLVWLGGDKGGKIFIHGIKTIMICIAVNPVGNTFHGCHIILHYCSSFIRK